METPVKSIPIEDAQVAAVATALREVGWNYPMMVDGAPRRTAQLAAGLVRAGVRMPATLTVPSWTEIAKLLLAEDLSLMVSLELLKDEENRVARVIQLAFNCGMRYAGVGVEL